MLEPLEMFLMIMGTAITAGTYSYILFPDNRFFAFNEALFLGGSAAYYLFTVYTSLRGTCFEPLVAGRLILIIPTILGIAIFSRLTRYRWLTRYSTSILSGIGLGVTFAETIKTQILQVMFDVGNFTVAGRRDYLWGSLMFVSVLTGIAYYTYSLFYSGPLHTGRLRSIVRIGRIFLYAAFAYMYGYICVENGIGSLSSYIVSYYRVPIDEFTIFTRGYGTNFASQLLVAGLGIPLAILVLHYMYWDVYRRRRPTLATSKSSVERS